MSNLMLLPFQCPQSIFGLCYHSVNVITFSLAQSDHIKRLLLYYLDVEEESVSGIDIVVTFESISPTCFNGYWSKKLNHFTNMNNYIQM